MAPLTGFSLPRLLHPVAWWVWGVGMAVAASRTTNPLLLVLVVVAGTYRRSRRGLARAFVAPRQARIAASCMPS